MNNTYICRYCLERHTGPATLGFHENECELKPSLRGKEPKPSISYEEEPAKNKVSNRALGTLKKVMYEQDDYGMDKYNEPLHHSYSYDWLQMFLQEQADGLKYIQNEMDRKEEVIKFLKSALEYKELSQKDELIKLALGLLTAGGREIK